MKVIALNGSPRKNWNTDTLLQNAYDMGKRLAEMAAQDNDGV